MIVSNIESPSKDWAPGQSVADRVKILLTILLLEIAGVDPFDLGFEMHQSRCAIGERIAPFARAMYGFRFAPSVLQANKNPGIAAGG